MRVLLAEMLQYKRLGTGTETIYEGQTPKFSSAIPTVVFPPTAVSCGDDDAGVPGWQGEAHRAFLEANLQTHRTVSWGQAPSLDSRLRSLVQSSPASDGSAGFPQAPTVVEVPVSVYDTGAAGTARRGRDGYPQPPANSPAFHFPSRVPSAESSGHDVSSMHQWHPSRPASLQRPAVPKWKGIGLRQFRMPTADLPVPSNTALTAHNTSVRIQIQRSRSDAAERSFDQDSIHQNQPSAGWQDLKERPSQYPCVQERQAGIVRESDERAYSFANEHKSTGESSERDRVGGGGSQNFRILITPRHPGDSAGRVSIVRTPSDLEPFEQQDREQQFSACSDTFFQELLLDSENDAPPSRAFNSKSVELEEEVFEPEGKQEERPREDTKIHCNVPMLKFLDSLGPQNSMDHLGVIDRSNADAGMFSLRSPKKSGRKKEETPRQQATLSPMSFPTLPSAQPTLGHNVPLNDGIPRESVLSSPPRHRQSTRSLASAQSPSPPRHVAIVGMIDTDSVSQNRCSHVCFPPDSSPSHSQSPLTARTVPTARSVTVTSRTSGARTGKIENEDSRCIIPLDTADTNQRLLSRGWKGHASDSFTGSDEEDPMSPFRALPVRLNFLTSPPRDERTGKMKSPNTSREEELCEWEEQTSSRSKERQTISFKPKGSNTTPRAMSERKQLGEQILRELSYLSSPRPSERERGTRKNIQRLVPKVPLSLQDGSSPRSERWYEETIRASAQEPGLLIVPDLKPLASDIPMVPSVKGSKVRSHIFEKQKIVHGVNGVIERSQEREATLDRILQGPFAAPESHVISKFGQGKERFRLEWGTGTGVRDVPFEEVQMACSDWDGEVHWDKLNYHQKTRVRATALHGRQCSTNPRRQQIHLHAAVYEERATRWICKRESVLTKVQNVLRSLPRSETDPGPDLRRQICDCLLDLRAYSVFLVEAISKWLRASRSETNVFLWENMDYLKKLQQDTGFIDTYWYVSETLNVQGPFAISFAPLRESQDSKHAMLVSSGHDSVAKEALVNSPPLADRDRMLKVLSFLRRRNERVKFNLPSAPTAVVNVLQLPPSPPSTAATCLPLVSHYQDDLSANVDAAAKLAEVSFHELDFGEDDIDDARTKLLEAPSVSLAKIVTDDMTRDDNVVPSRPENRARFPPWKGRANHQAVALEAVTPGPANRTSTHPLNERSVFLRREEGESSSISQRAHAEAGAGPGPEDMRG